ncbi:MAG: hypothetical protein ACRD1V_08245 [Vicinamibacterales bacterium]
MLRHRWRDRLLGTVPISIVLHLAAIVLLVVVPLTASMTLPSLTATVPDFVQTVRFTMQ